MTTRIRVERACSEAGIPVLVQEQGVGDDGKWVNCGQPIALLNAAQLLELHIHQNKRYVVGEMQLGNA